MPQFDEQHVKLCGGFIVWDGVTQPEIVQQGAKAGGQKWTLKVVFPPNCPDLPIFDQLANKQLAESKFRGQLPAGGRMPIGQVQPGEFGDHFPGWLVISFKTTLKTPDVYDENGAPIDPMQFNQVIYSGQKVDVLAHCYDYDAAGNRGIAAGLDAFAVIQSAQAPRLQIGGAGVNTASAFGGGGAPQNPNGQPPAGNGYGQPQHQGAGYAGAGAGTPQNGTPSAGTAGPGPNNGAGTQPGYNPNPQPPAGQGYGQPQGGYDPNQGGHPTQAPPQGGYNPNQQPPQNQGYGQPQGHQAPPQNQGGGYPNQAHNFLPGQGQ